MNKLITIAVIFALAVMAIAQTCPPTGACSVSGSPCVTSQTNSNDASDPGVFPRRTNLYFPPANNTYTQTITFPTPTVGEVMILQDIGPGVDSDDIASVSNTIQALYNFLVRDWPTLKLGFATFNQSMGSYMARTTLSNDVSNRGYLKNAIDGVAANYAKRNDPILPNGAVLDAVIDAAKDTNFGWGKYSAKFIIVLTRFGFPTATPFMNQASFKANLLQYGALPIFCTKIDQNPNGKSQFQALVNSIKLGVVGNGNTPSNNLLAQDQGNWNQLGKFGVDLLRTNYFGIGQSTSNIQHVITQGAEYVESIVYSKSGNNIIATIVYRWGSPTHTVSPYVVINFVGYGEVITTMKTNTPPSLSSGTYTVAQTSTVDFKLTGTDVDGNALSISYDGPTGAQGAFIGTSASAGSAPTTFSGTYDPVDSFTGTFTVPATVSDGCANAAGQLTFTVTYVNKPPTAQDISTTTPKNKDVTISFASSVADPDTTPSTLLKIVIVTLPSQSSGTLLVGGSAITSPNTQITGQSVVFRPAANFVGDNVEFTYKAVDNTNLESNTATVSVDVTPTNAAPVLSTDKPSVTLGQSSTAVVTVFVSDSDIPDSDDVTLMTDDVGGNANFASITVSTGNSFASTIATVNTNGGTKAFTITFTTISSTSAFSGTFSLQAKDTAGATSNTVSVTVTVTATPPPVNNNPYTTAPGAQNTDMNKDIVNIPLTGKDDDAADNANLRVFLTLLPQHGTLYYNNVAIASTGVLTTTLRTTPDSTYPVTYRPNPNSLSDDSFSFYVQDPSGATSPSREVPITINNVNQPPTSADKTVTTAQDTQASFTLSTFDPESQVTTIELINVPAGVTPSSGSVSAPYSFTYDPPAGQFSNPDGSAFATMTFKAKDSMNAESVSTYTVTFIVDRLKTPPTSQDETITTKQNTAATVTLTGAGRAPIVAVIDIPSGFKGTLYSDSAMTSAISTGFTTSSARTLYYMPPQDGVSVNGAIFTQFYFKVSDSDNLLSVATYTTTIYVTPNNYGGSKIVNINEDSVGLITLTPTDSFTSTDSNALTGVISAVNSGNGALYFCTSESACTSTAISGTPAIASDVKFAKFVPAAEDSASPYATFSYTLTDTNTQIEATYDVTINVIPVNDPPVITPDFQDRESTPADTPLKLTFSGSDIDDAVETLISVVTYLPQRGSLFRSVNGAQGTEITEADNSVSATTPGKFEVFFVPTPGSSGRNYATVAFAIEDPHGARSTNAFVTINVTPVNRPPTVKVGGPYRVVQSDTLPIAETSVSDPDVGNFNMLVTLQLEAGSIGTFTLTDERAFQGPCSWNADNTVLSCKAAENKLNNFLASLTFTSDVTGVHNIIVTVDDLNNGASSDLRGTPGLTDTDKIEVTVVPPSTIVTDENNQDLTIALSVSGAGALAALGIGGFFLGRKLKKAAPADDYFSFMNDDSNDVKINPLFASKYGGPADNPVYTAQV